MFSGTRLLMGDMCLAAGTDTVEFITFQAEIDNMSDISIWIIQMGVEMIVGLDTPGILGGNGHIMDV